MTSRTVAEEEGQWLAEERCARTWATLCAVRAMERELATIALRVCPDAESVVPAEQHAGLIAWEKRALRAWLEAVKGLADAG